MAVLEKLFERMDAKLDRLTDAVEAMRVDFGGLKASVATRSDLAATRADVAELKGSIKHLPTVWMMLTAMIGFAVAVAGGVVGGVFAALRYTGHG